jgi:hypothetical protein
MIPHLPLAWWLLGLALIFAGGIFEASFRLSRETHDEIASFANNRKSIRNSLTSLYLDGQSIMQKCLDQQLEPPHVEANDWAKKVESFLSETLEGSYVARFRDNSDIMDVRPVGQFSQDSINLWRAVRSRIIRMNEFIKELSV